MESKKIFLQFLEFLKKWMVIMSKNGKLMAIVTSIYIIIASLFFVLNISTVKPMIFDIVTKSMMLPSQDPQGLVFAQLQNTMQKEFKIFLGTELAFIVGLFITSLIAQNAIILLIGSAHKDEKISHINLILRMPQPLKRTFITSFHVTLLRIGFLYISFFFVMVLIIVTSGNKIVSKLILWALLILVVSMYLYFSVVWILSMVVSVLEECSGIEALGRAGRLVKGMKLQGFLLNLLLNLLSYVFFHFLSKMMMVKQPALTQAILLFFLMGFICSITMFTFQAYTVLYFECKKNHGEEIELHGSVEYSKIPRVPLGEELL
ncbi:uncharacterized protein LOC111894826 [Lactuca sativa]|uniref:Uncharacterized protein n=1 Tax=Lactuca sativa TaxID=4236 RepID=A0A9R1WZE8_LACSA|nr:uncharacterized protein LOC111894826 [Lactuca sativa]KAJ0192414.1 hypothetical protein LSAT_V11C800415440 [Lactuca sativa]